MTTNRSTAGSFFCTDVLCERKRRKKTKLTKEKIEFRFCSCKVNILGS